MELEFIKKEKNEIELIVKQEDVSFFYLIENIASSKREVEFVALKNADHLKKEFQLYIKTKDKPAKDVLLDCIQEAEKNLETILSSLEKVTVE
jgi:DNA-directed RNA polymerase subunit L